MFAQLVGTLLLIVLLYSIIWKLIGKRLIDAIAGPETVDEMDKNILKLEKEAASYAKELNGTNRETEVADELVKVLMQLKAAKHKREQIITKLEKKKDEVNGES